MAHNRARSFVVIMLIIGAAALLLRLTVEQLIKFNIEQNQSNAQSTLKLISTALENYAKNNHAVFPQDLSILTKPESRYLDRDYIAYSPSKGYNYGCARLEQSGYSCYAAPLKCGLSGKMTYTVSTGGLFVSEKCNKRE